MNNPHQNARTTLLGRADMIRRILEEGLPVRAVARGFGISARTARKGLARFKAEGPSGFDNRSSRPRTVANRTGAYWIGVIEMLLRREYRLTAEEIAGKLKLAHSTVAAWLTRRGLGRLTALEPKEPARRYQRQRPGELIHLDIKKLACCERVGHRITGDRRDPSAGAGYD
jgi:transposase-like protein